MFISPRCKERFNAIAALEELLPVIRNLCGEKGTEHIEAVSARLRADLAESIYPEHFTGLANSAAVSTGE
ncbi:hypothetical protein [Caballeronia sp. LZ035]|uniref:hypothetical protein n=1 Tax=Caballeronia sp. LZ035 TaxID=3038568 RepID=UPI00285ECFE1|nr:hypothetical protein [Caballeronia sp. LZ035]MDR5757654.1 hypothetical protein [Caballeronia sp. LZ035]